VNLDDEALIRAYDVPDRHAWRQDAWVRVNFVMSLDGAISGPEGVSGSLGTDADRQVFRIARRHADVVLVGAGTVRAENYSPSRIPTAIVTRSANLPPDLRLFSERGPEHARPIILTTSHAASQAPSWLADACEVLDCGADSVDLKVALQALIDRGLVKVLCEGGPALLTDLIDLDLVDELLLTLAPTLVGGSDHLTNRSGGFTPPRRFVPIQVIEHEGTILTRLHRA